MRYFVDQTIDAHRRLGEMGKRLEKLEEALRFYADNASYCKIYGFKDDDPRGFAPVLQDDGKIARAALAEAPQADDVPEPAGDWVVQLSDATGHRCFVASESHVNTKLSLTSVSLEGARRFATDKAAHDWIAERGWCDDWRPVNLSELTLPG